MNREQVVEGIANVEREFNDMSGTSMSDDSLVVLYRKLQGLAPLVGQFGLPTAKLDELDEAIVLAMSQDARERVFTNSLQSMAESYGATLPAELDPDYETQEDIDATRVEMERKFRDIDEPPLDDDGNCVECGYEPARCRCPERPDPMGGTIDQRQLDEPARKNRTPQKSEDERRKDVTDLFGDLSL